MKLYLVAISGNSYKVTIAKRLLREAMAFLGPET